MLAFISELGRRYVQRCRSERAYRQLHAMDTRMLRDLGLDRSRIALMQDATRWPHAA
jgi:uncharacterized protein YjiS (DUF1127 family)